MRRTGDYLIVQAVKWRLTMWELGAFAYGNLCIRYV